MSSVCTFPASGSSVISSCQSVSASRRKATIRTSVSRAAQSGANACVNAFQRFHGWHSMALPGCLRADCPFAPAGCGGGASYTSTALSKAFHRLCQRWSVRRAVHPDAGAARGMDVDTCSSSPVPADGTIWLDSAREARHCSWILHCVTLSASSRAPLRDAARSYLYTSSPSPRNAGC